mmetsp:Transcript_7992/g.49375  ORF Transcript_7992/g.49375 Transcript_7992/m.49375 type:complete len:204 (+) Transcript_7992:987-1598(+)
MASACVAFASIRMRGGGRMTTAPREVRGRPIPLHQGNGSAAHVWTLRSINRWHETSAALCVLWMNAPGKLPSIPRIPQLPFQDPIFLHEQVAVWASRLPVPVLIVHQKLLIAVQPQGQLCKGMAGIFWIQPHQPSLQDLDQLQRLMDGPFDAIPMCGFPGLDLPLHGRQGGRCRVLPQLRKVSSGVQRAYFLVDLSHFLLELP